LYAALVSLFLIAVAIAWNFYTIRSGARWFVWSHRYKAEVLAQPNAVGATSLRHVSEVCASLIAKAETSRQFPLRSSHNSGSLSRFLA